MSIVISVISTLKDEKMCGTGQISTANVQMKLSV